MLNNIKELGQYKCGDCAIYEKSEITIRKNKYCKCVSREVEKDSASCMAYSKHN